MKTAIGIVIALVIMAVVGTVLARLMQRDFEIAEMKVASPEPEETEAPTEELAEASA